LPIGSVGNSKACFSTHKLFIPALSFKNLVGNQCDLHSPNKNLSVKNESIDTEKIWCCRILF